MKDRTKHALPADDPGVRRSKREEYERRHQHRILQAAREKPKMEPEVRKTVARNLFRLLREAETRGISKLKVLRKANQSNLNESTKRLIYFALDPDLKGTEKEGKRAELLRVKTADYIKIAQALAELQGLPENEHVLSLFSDTPYTSGPPEPPDGAVNTYVPAFQQLLKEMIEKIAVKYDLASYFERVERARIPAYRLDPEKYWLQHSEAQPSSVLGGMDETVFYGGDVGGLPSVALYGGFYGPEVEDRLHVSRKSIATSMEQFPKIAGTIAFEPPISVRVRLWRELRLCICPVAGSLLPQPAFELRRSLRVNAEDLEVDLRQLCVSELQGQFPVRRGDVQFLGRLDLEQDLAGPPEIETVGDEKLAPIDWIWFAKATQANCRRLLDRPPERDMELAPQLATVHPGETGFPADTIGAAVEEALYDGTIYRLLVSDVQRRVEILEQYCRAREEALARRRSAARKLWD